MQDSGAAVSTDVADSTGVSDDSGHADRGFFIGVASAAVLGLFVRVAYTLVVLRHTVVAGDPLFYRLQGRLLAEGHLFVDPFFWLYGLGLRPSSYHPPLFTVFQSLLWSVGLRSVLSQRLATSVLGVAGVVAIGFAGRAIAGRRAGVIAAVLAAIWPLVWINDPLMSAESLLTLMTALTLLAASRFWHRPTKVAAGLLGAAIGLMALTRAETAMLLVFLGVPLIVLAARGSDRPAPWRGLAAFALGAIIVMGPWVSWNLVRFNQPVLLSNGFGGTLSVSNRNGVYDGPRLGWWTIQWTGTGRFSKPPALPSSKDEAELERVSRHRAFDYISHHLGDQPRVMLARLGRMSGLYRPWQTAELDASEGRGVWPSRLGILGTLATLPFAIYGMVLLRRRREPILPMVAIGVMTILTGALFWGAPRFAVPWAVAACVLTGAAFDQIWQRVRGRAASTPGEEALPEPPVDART